MHNKWFVNIKDLDLKVPVVLCNPEKKPSFRERMIPRSKKDGKSRKSIWIIGCFPLPNYQLIRQKAGYLHSVRNPEADTDYRTDMPLHCASARDSPDQALDCYDVAPANF